MQLGKTQLHYIPNKTSALCKDLHRHAKTKLVKTPNNINGVRVLTPSSADRSCSSTGDKGSDEQSGLYPCNLHFYWFMFLKKNQCDDCFEVSLG